MMSRFRLEKETWPEEEEFPPVYNLQQQLNQLQNVTRSLFANNVENHVPKLDQMYSNSPLNGQMESDLYDFFSSSPMSYGEQYPDYPLQLSANSYTGNDTHDLALADFFGEQFAGMEETFRSALMQYFTQVDREKEGLNDDLRKIKNDFRKYEEEGQKFKIDNQQKGKIIRKLTENGKLFVKEIERLKDELKELERQRRQLIGENNDLQKKVQYENEVIPHLESELRNLSEENQYLKLLADDTNTLNQKEHEIRRYQHQVERQQKICQQHTNNINKQNHSIQQYSRLNDELCINIKELTPYKDECEQLKGIRSKYEGLKHDFKKLQNQHKEEKNGIEELTKILNDNKKELDETKKEICRWKEKCFITDRNLKDKESLLKKFESRFQEYQLQHGNDTDELKQQENIIREVNETNDRFKREIQSLKKDFKLNNIKMDELIYEDELRNKELENLNNKYKQLENRYGDREKEERNLKNNIIEKEEKMQLFITSERIYKKRISDLQDTVQNLKDKVYHLEAKEVQQSTRVRDLENEILAHVKIQSEMEQEIAITDITIETLKKSNDSCNEQRAKLQKELLIDQEKIFRLEDENRKRYNMDLEFKNEMNELQKSYRICENENNYLEEELAVTKEKFVISKLRICECEDLLRETDFFKKELRKCQKDLIERENKSCELCGKNGVDNISTGQNSSEYLKKKLTQCENELKCYKMEQNLSSGSNGISKKEEKNEKTEDDDDENDKRLKKELIDRTDMFFNNKKENEEEEEELNHHNIKSMYGVRQNEKLNNALENEAKHAEIRHENEELKKIIENLQERLKEAFNQLKSLQQEYKVNQKELYIKELNEREIEFESNIQNKNLLICKLESCIEKLQNELGKVKNEENSVFELQEYSLKLSEEVIYKNREICDLEIHVQKLQQTIRKLKKQNEEIVKDFEKLQQCNRTEENEKEELFKEFEKLEQSFRTKEKEKKELLEEFENSKKFYCQQKIENEKLINQSREKIRILKIQIKGLKKKEKEEEEEEKVLNKSFKGSVDGTVESLNKSFDESELDTTKESVLSQEQKKKKNKEANLKENNIKLKNTLKEKNSLIEELETDIVKLCGELTSIQNGALLHQNNQNGALLDYSYEDQHVINKQKYIDVVEELEKNQKLIGDLKEHICFLEEEINLFTNTTNSLNTSSQDVLEDNPMRASSSKTFELKLPQPELLINKAMSLHTNSLPPTPDNCSNRIITPRPTAITAESDKKQFELERQQQRFEQEIEMRKGSALKLETVNELRRKLVKLNSELIQRKLDIGNYEEELKISKRKQERSEYAYRNLAAKNQSLEREVQQYRKQIRDVKTDQNKTELSKNQQKREIYNYKLNVEELEKKCAVMKNTIEKLEEESKEKTETQTQLKIEIEESSAEIKHWKYKVEILENECQTLTTTIETLQSEITRQRYELNKYDVNLKMTSNERDSWKNNTENCEGKCEELKCERTMLQDEMLVKIKLNEQLKEKLEITKQERDIFELSVKEKSEILTKYEKMLDELKEEKRLLEKENFDVNDKYHKMTMTHKELNAEQGLSMHNRRYLENLIEELKIQMKEKEERLNKYRNQHRDDENLNSTLKDEFNYTSIELQRVMDELNTEQENSMRLEKLNNDMNKENKRLMLEIKSLQEKLKHLAEEAEFNRLKMLKLEREQNGLDNLVIKTQKSNSELLDSNKDVQERYRIQCNRLESLKIELEDQIEEKNEIERNLVVAEKQLHEKTETLSKNNKELLDELNKSKQMINEFEGILDQGQLDFDELEIQLEIYRKENIELDVKLHEVSKEKVKSEINLEGMIKNIEGLNNECTLQKEELEKEKQELEKCLKEKENIEIKFQDCKSREEYFEERLRGYENTLASKTELLENEKKTKEKMQNDILRLQSELIEAKGAIDKMHGERERKNEELRENVRNIELLETNGLNMSLEKADFNTKIEEQQKMLEGLNEQVLQYKRGRDEIEGRFQQVLLQVQDLETQLEDEKLKHHNMKESTLVEISTLKRSLNEKEVYREKQNYQYLTQEIDLKEEQKLNEKLKEKIKILEEENIKEREILNDETKVWQEKTNLIEEQKTQEIIQLKATMEAIEESRGHDLSLLKFKLRESEQLEEQLKEEEKERLQKEMEIEALKEDIVQLQTTLNKSDGGNKELMKEMTQLSALIAYMEKNKTVTDMNKMKLIGDIKDKEESIKILEEYKQIKSMERNNARTENERLKLSFDKIIEEKNLENEKLNKKVLKLRSQVITFESLKEENENLKIDLDAILGERRELHAKVGENTQLRANNYDLKAKADRVQEYINENRMLRQELREKENRHIEVVEKVNRENITLRRNVDDLFKKNQDLELRNVTYVRTRPRSSLYFEPHSSKLDPVTLTIRPKSASVDNINEVGYNEESFSPTRHGVATSTPTQESRSFTSVMVTKAPSMERLNLYGGGTVNTVGASKVSSVEYEGSFQAQQKNQLSTGPLVESHRKENDADIQQEDANWQGSQQQQDGLNLFIKANPFLQRDKSTKSQWKNVVSSVNPSIKPAQQQRDALMFDIRSQSSSIDEDTTTTRNVPQQKILGIGNNFVNRLKANFEKK